MGFTASVVTAALKAVVGEKFGGGLTKDLIGISIDGITEKGINEITDFINREKLKIDSILSKENTESMGISEDYFDYVVTEIKELLPKIDITDEVLRQCKYDSMNLSAFLWDKYKECKNDYIEYESEIKRCLFTVAEALIKLVRESENFEKDVLIHISNSVDDTNVELQKISDYMDSNFGKLNADNRVILEILQIILKQNQEESKKNKDKKQKIKSRTQEYADKWKENMFLNNFDKHDGDIGINVKLKDVYLEKHLPYFRWRNNEGDPDTKLKKLLSEYIYTQDKRKMLLVLGQPGIGKSTLITWIIINFKKVVENILVYQFASDLKNMDVCNLDKDKKVITLGELELSLDDLEGKILILDGFDEISLKRDRTEVLNRLYKYLIKEDLLRKFSLIVTCRENYIQNVYRIDCDYVTLQSWGVSQIQSFCKIYSKKTKSDISDSTMMNIIKNKDVLGIPLILYMVLALDISVEKEGSIVDVYDQIFSLKEGGIYERCFVNIKKNKMEKYADPHWVYSLKEQIHQISRDISLWMFENNPNEASILQDKYTEICTNIVKKSNQNTDNIEQDVLIGSYFKMVRHTEGIDTEKLGFVHRSIYEYFVVEALYNSIEDAMLELTEESQEVLAKNISYYLKKGDISGNIGEYLKYKILQLYNTLGYEKKEGFYYWWESAVNKMMEMGMFYYMEKNMIDYKNILAKEMNCFLNLITILSFIIRKEEFITINKRQLEMYIRCISFQPKKPNLNGFNLKGCNLSGLLLMDACLQNTNIEGANLRGINLKGANLKNANLTGANLENTSLINANLTGANLTKISLKGADLSRANLKAADLKETNLRWINLVTSLKDTSLEGTDLSGANLEGANLRGIHLERANLEKTILNHVNLEGANLYKASLINASLEEANFEETRLEEADLSEAKLFKTNLKKAILKKTDLIGADLTWADLKGSNLEGASLYGAILIKANLDEANLEEANINYSIWTQEDLYQILPKLAHTVFKYIIIEKKGERKKICRQDIFLN